MLIKKTATLPHNLKFFIDYHIFIGNDFFQIFLELDKLIGKNSYKYVYVYVYTYDIKEY